MDFLVQITPTMIALIAIVVGLTQVVKAFVSDARFYPLISLVLAVAASFLLPQATIGATILAGLVMGLSASGLYSGTKTVVS